MTELEKRNIEETLSELGTVDQLEIIDDNVHIKITDGFTGTLAHSNIAISMCVSFFRDFPIVKKHTIDKNLFHLILKRK